MRKRFRGNTVGLNASKIQESSRSPKAMDPRSSVVDMASSNAS